jgi:hypothetical protein
MKAVVARDRRGTRRGSLPEFQHPEVGDTIAFGSNRMRLELAEPNHVLAWRSEDGN